MSEFRSQPSVVAGTKIISCEHSPVTLVEYQPGNGTRYCLSFVKFSSNFDEEMMLKVLKREKGSWLVTVHNLLGLTQSGWFNTHTRFDWKYVKAVFKLDSYADAVVLAELISHVTGAPCLPIEEMEAQAEVAALASVNRK